VVGCITKQGSTRSAPLHHLTTTILELAHSRNTSLVARHFQGDRNVSADLLSRTRPVKTEWTISQRAFEDLLSWHGPLQVDLFATRENAKLDRFWCPYPLPLAEGTDALTLDWNREVQIFLFPPPALRGKVFALLREYKGHGLLITPDLPHTPGFGLLTKITLKKRLVSDIFQMVQGVKHVNFPPSYARLTAFSF
jgi:hypothetical protein